MYMYTPVIKQSGQRIEINKYQFSPGFSHARSRGNKGVVVDLITQKLYAIEGKSCGLPNCMCDAWATEIDLNDKRAATVKPLVLPAFARSNPTAARGKDASAHY